MTHKSTERKHYFVVYRRYLRVNRLMQRQSIIKYLYIGWHRATWRVDPTKAAHFETQEEAFKWADKYHANVTHMSEEA